MVNNNNPAFIMNPTSCHWTSNLAVHLQMICSLIAIVTTCCKDCKSCGMNYSCMIEQMSNGSVFLPPYYRSWLPKLNNISSNSTLQILKAVNSILIFKKRSYFLLEAKFTFDTCIANLCSSLFATFIIYQQTLQVGAILPIFS